MRRQLVSGLFLRLWTCLGWEFVLWKSQKNLKLAEQYCSKRLCPIVWSLCRVLGVKPVHICPEPSLAVNLLPLQPVPLCVRLDCPLGEYQRGFWRSLETRRLHAASYPRNGIYLKFYFCRTRHKPINDASVHSLVKVSTRTRHSRRRPRSFTTLKYRAKRSSAFTW